MLLYANFVSLCPKWKRLHYDAVKWIFRYLKGTTNHGITFSSEQGDSFAVRYVDLDYAYDIDDKRSKDEVEYMEVGEVIK